MAVKLLVNNLFQSKSQSLVNTVTRRDDMDRGLALEFKKRFPEMYEDFIRRQRTNKIRVGQPYVYRYLISWIVNFPMNESWDSEIDLDDVVSGLVFIERHYVEWGISSLAVPSIGCGKGQLEWSLVGPTLYHYLDRLDIPVELYAPYGTPQEELQHSFLEPMPKETY